jgi:hypothetical protein
VDRDTKSGKERVNYRHYEEDQIILERIRTYRTQRYHDHEIMRLLDNMPRRTSYNFVKKLQQQDSELMKQWMAENVALVSEEIMIYRETSCQKLRELQAIIDNKDTSPREKMRAIDKQFVISEKLVSFARSGISDNMKVAGFGALQTY